MSIESDAYEKHKNLKLAANEIGMNWQTLYTKLRKQGVAVTGDKERYGSPSDKLGRAGEVLFKTLCPDAIDMNERTFQAPYDFSVLNHRVDVKVSRQNSYDKRNKDLKRWSFLVSRQIDKCDFLCCLCIGPDGESIAKVILVPSEFLSGMQCLSLSCGGKSKWDEFSLPPADLAKFFADLPAAEKPAELVASTPESNPTTGLKLRNSGAAAECAANEQR